MIHRGSASRKHGTEAKQWWRANRKEDLFTLCDERGIDYQELTPYQIRVAGKIDFYPTNGRAHILSKNKRVGYHTAHDVRRLLEQIEQGKV